MLSSHLWAAQGPETLTVNSPALSNMCSLPTGNAPHLASSPISRTTSNLQGPQPAGFHRPQSPCEPITVARGHEGSPLFLLPIKLPPAALLPLSQSTTRCGTVWCVVCGVWCVGLSFPCWEHTWLRSCCSPHASGIGCAYVWLSHTMPDEISLSHQWDE